MKSIICLTCLLLTTFVASSVMAEETKPLTDEAELSYIQTGGNTELTSFSAKNLLTYRPTARIKLEWTVAALYGESDGDTIAERYATDLRGEYSFTERFYAAARGGWESDEFAGIDDRYYVGPAIGYRFLLGPTHFLETEAGVDYVSEEYTDDTNDDYLRGRAFAKYELVLSEKTKFTQTGEYLHDFENGDNYTINSETALITALSNALSLKTSYTVAYDNEPIPEDLEETDTALAVTLIVNF